MTLKVCVDRLCSVSKEKWFNCISVIFFLYFSKSHDQAWLILSILTGRKYENIWRGMFWRRAFIFSKNFLENCHKSNVVVFACSVNVLQYTEA